MEKLECGIVFVRVLILQMYHRLKAVFRQLTQFATVIWLLYYVFKVFCCLNVSCLIVDAPPGRNGELVFGEK